MLDIMALSPHPDDVELSCGGLIAKMSEKRYRVGIIDLTKGELGTEGTSNIRIKEAKKAAEVLGTQIRENMDFGDCKLDQSFDKSVRLADAIRQHRPSLVIAPYGDGHHPDHTAASKLAKKAVFLAKLVKIKTDHHAHSVRAIVHYMLHQAFDAPLVVDVTQHYDTKLEAIKAYKSQTNLIHGIRGLLEQVKLRDQFFGSKIGVKYGEPYYYDKPLKIDDPVIELR
ncbi:MAG: bacillithiol biosynthesis deacetylase BshB1 [Candidatus Bathyarchaeota archaeon]|nr:bacillithiol biosynthesis deacetylase BshB1 [Candidatus Bathyarchaeota archaeon]